MIWAVNNCLKNYTHLFCCHVLWSQHHLFGLAKKYEHGHDYTWGRNHRLGDHWVTTLCFKLISKLGYYRIFFQFPFMHRIGKRKKHSLLNFLFWLWEYLLRKQGTISIFHDLFYFEKTIEQWYIDCCAPLEKYFLVFLELDFWCVLNWNQFNFERLSGDLLVISSWQGVLAGQGISANGLIAVKIWGVLEMTHYVCMKCSKSSEAVKSNILTLKTSH